MFMVTMELKVIDQNLPKYSADDLLYSANTKDRLTLKQRDWLFNFIDVWDLIDSNT